MPHPTPHFAVLAVDMKEPTQGTVVSLHPDERTARAARNAYRGDAARRQPDLYVIGPVPAATPVGSLIPLTGGRPG
jgi:hypothetical protein